MIKVENLTFEYPGIRALDNISLGINKGDIMALVGPNGAGKTTLLHCMAALDAPLSGTILLEGRNVLDDPRACHQKIGYLPDFFGLYTELTIRQCLTYMAMAHKIQPTNINQSVIRAARRLKIDDRLEDKAGTLSRGLKQRLAIAQSIVHEPEILLLDEPASGLDPEARKSLSELFLELRDQGMTLVVSSHILSELEDYCTNMIIVRDGKIVEHKLIERENENLITIILQAINEQTEIIQILKKTDQVSCVTPAREGVSFRYPGDRQLQGRLLRQLMEQGINIYSFTTEKKNMQDAYLEQVGKLG
ncbi:MAG TPA: ABC transporter ATP-binding protein [Gammaproteobacteria bacterium]|nr:ABC transporter ATP-binding protein [Gammaproteobacteria bacterium]